MTIPHGIKDPEVNGTIPRRHGSIYLAGPMRGVDRFNFPAFDAAAKRLREAGWHVLSPAEHDRDAGFDETLNSLSGFDIDAAFAWDLEQIRHCDAIYLLHGWERSTGALAELSVARMLQKHIIYEEEGYEAQPRLNSEVRIVNGDTGGAKGRKLARFDLIPAGPLTAVAEHYGRGAEKYDDRNWERGYDWSLSFGALMRHAWAFWNGEDIDAETGGHHLAAVVFHAFGLMEFGRTHPELDDRPNTST